MTAVRESILAYVATQLGTISGASVTRHTHKRAAPAANAPRLNLIGGGHRSDSTQLANTTVTTMEFVVEIYVRGDETALHAVYESAVAKVLADRTQNGKAVDTREVALLEAELPVDWTDAAFIGASLSFECEFHTDEADVGQVSG